MDAENILAALFEGESIPHVPFAESKFELRNKSGIVVADDMSYVVARRTRAEYRTMFGGTFDIVETYTRDRNDHEYFVGNPSTFSHVPSHVLGSTPMFDVYASNGRLLASNIPAGAADYTVAQFDGAYTVQYNPARNTAPTPTTNKPSKRGPALVGSSRETRRIESHIPDEVLRKASNTFAILDPVTLEVIFYGTKDMCIAHIKSHKTLLRRARAHALHIVRFLSADNFAREMFTTGYTVYAHGAPIFVGTKDAARNFIKFHIKYTKSSLSDYRVSSNEG